MILGEPEAGLLHWWLVDGKMYVHSDGYRPTGAIWITDIDVYLDWVHRSGRPVGFF
jgi:hypothetical protein